MNVLVLNCGSSSIKFQVIETSRALIAESKDRLLARGMVDRIGSTGAIATFERPGAAPERSAGELGGIREALASILDWVTASGSDRIDAVGHRVVHGGERFQQSMLITPDVEAGIEACIDFAPLHNPHNLRGIRACREIFG